MDYVQWIRQRVGRRKIFLAFGTVILRDGYGRILLQKRADFDFWGLPGGALELPPGAPLALFALGRTAGWIGQAIEQYQVGQLIRPRARYVGVRPKIEGGD